MHIYIGSLSGYSISIVGKNTKQKSIHFFANGHFFGHQKCPNLQTSMDSSKRVFLKNAKCDAIQARTMYGKEIDGRLKKRFFEKS